MIRLPKHGVGRSLCIALAVVTLSTFLPTSVSTNRRYTPLDKDNFTVKEVTLDHLRPDSRVRWQENIAKAESQGYQVRETKVFVAEPKAMTWLQKWTTVDAQTEYEYFAGGMLVFTVLDDSNYANIEYQIHYIDAIHEYELWGKQQMESNGSTTEWDEGMYVQGYVGKGGKALESFCEAISPTAHAQTTWQGRPCGQTWQIVQGVLWRAGGWSGGAFFSAVAPCMFSTPGFYGPCVVGAASGGYIWGLIYEGYDAGMTCRQGRPWSV